MKKPPDKGGLFALGSRLGSRNTPSTPAVGQHSKERLTHTYRPSRKGPYGGRGGSLCGEFGLISRKVDFAKRKIESRKYIFKA